jgi:predicted DNA-binding transcriptional regulator YafY
VNRLKGLRVHSAKRPALRRLFTIDRELREQQFPTAGRLAELCEVNIKTIERDLAYLRDQYLAPVEYCRKRRGWRYSEPTYRLPAVLITEGELVALFLAGQLLGQHRGTPYEAALARTIEKLADLLPDEVSVQWASVEQAHSFRSSVTSLADVELFRKLADCVIRRKQIRVRYWTASREAETERVIDPWHLTLVDGEWFLIGFCRLRNAERMFAPGRIRELVETGETFEVPASFSPARYFEGTFRVIRGDETAPRKTVRLRFGPGAARYVREKLHHPSQILTELADGWLEAQFTLGTLLEVKRWILNWGAECEVLEPADLREELVREAAAMLGVYGERLDGGRDTAVPESAALDSTGTVREGLDAKHLAPSQADRGRRRKEVG